MKLTTAAIRALKAANRAAAGMVIGANTGFASGSRAGAANARTPRLSGINRAAAE